MSPTDTGYQPRTAKDALPRPAGGNERKVGQGLLALLGVLVLGVGVPVALVLFVGNPLPTSLPTRDWLTADMSATVIIRIIAALVWVVWAHFVVCLLSEWRAIRAGRMPDAVPFGGGSQLVARRLIAGLLLLTGAATLGAQLGGRGDTAAPPQVTTVAAAAQRVGLPTPLLTPELRADAAAQAASAHAATTAAQPEVTKFYEVKPPAGRHHDTLWDIADRTLGEPLRYKEIYDLNKDRPQADGRKLVDANLIQPGWQLVMPADATGPGIRTVDAPRAAPTPAGQGSTTSARSGVSGGQSADLLHRSDVRTTVTAEHPAGAGHRPRPAAARRWAGAGRTGHRGHRQAWPVRRAVRGRGLAAPRREHPARRPARPGAARAVGVPHRPGPAHARPVGGLPLRRAGGRPRGR